MQSLVRSAGGVSATISRLRDASSASWPSHGVYFFFDEAEPRASGIGARCVRVGTHALLHGSKSTLWKRLRQHRGDRNGGGAHRTSVFRRLVGQALIARDGSNVPSWCGVKPAAGPALDEEKAHECRVSEEIRALPLLALPVADTAQRDRIERCAIALLSNANPGVPIDPPSPAWLGLHSPSERTRRSGLWNRNYVREAYSPAVLDKLEHLVVAQGNGPDL